MNHSIQALGWTLIHFCWQAAAIVVAYRLIDAALSRSRSQVRYVAALSAVMSLLVAAAATFAYEQQRVSIESASYALVAVDGRTIYAQPDRDNTAIAKAPSNIDTGIFHGLRRTAASAGSSVLRALPGDMLSLIDTIWLAGVMALSVRLFGGWMTIRRLRSSTTASAPIPVYAAFVRLAAKMGISRRVDLRVCQRVVGPVAIGVIRSVIILPAAALSHLSPEQLEVVLAHELAHIRRADYLWNMLQTIVETLFFFHPAVWWLGNQTRQLRELCCDDEALSACGDPMVYATALLRLEEQRSHRVQLAMAIHGQGGGLKSRILRILEGGHDVPSIRGREVIPMSLAGVAATLAVFLLPVPRTIAKAAVVTQKPSIAKVEAASPQPAAAPSEPVETPTPQTAHVENEIVSPVVTVEPRIDLHVSPLPAVAPVLPASPEIVVAPHIALHAVELRPKIAVNIAAMATSANSIVVRSFVAQAKADDLAAPGRDFVDTMHALGYNDLDKLIAMRVHGITPEYAQRIAKAGYGTPSADELIELKIFGITPEEVEKMHTQNGDRSALKELVRYKIFKVTPEFVSGMKDAGFGDLSPEKLVALRIQNVTPEFARSMHQKYPQITAEQLVQMKIFRIDDAFIATAKSHGFDSLSLEKLIRLRMSGLLDDNSVQR